MTQKRFTVTTDMARILLWLWSMPLLSVAEMTVVTGLPAHRCYRLLPMLVAANLVCSVRLGMLCPAKERWVLTSLGIGHIRRTTGRPAPWAVREKNLQWVIWRLPHLEAAYRDLPCLWAHEGMTGSRMVPTNAGPDPDEIAFPEDLNLTGFRWLRDANLHAVATYSNRSWVLGVGIGSAVTPTVLREKRERALRVLESPTPGARPRQPAAWVLTASDRLSAIQAAEIWSEPNVMAVAGDGSVVKTMVPDLFTGPFAEDPGRTPIGKPEKIPSWAQSHPVISTLNGKSNYRLFRFVAEWSGPSHAQIQRKMSDSNATVDRMIKQSMEADVFQYRDGRYRLGEKGILAVSRLDRVSHKFAGGHIRGYQSPAGNRLARTERHERTLIDLATAMERAKDLGIEVYNGVRAIRNIEGVSAISADAVVTLGRYRAHRVLYLELELAAAAPAHCRRRLHPYRLARQLGHEIYPFIIVCPSRRVEENYWRLGRGLHVVTSTVDEMLTGPYSGPDSVLRLFGEPQSIDEL